MTRIYEDLTDNEGIDPDQFPAAANEDNPVAAAREVVEHKSARLVHGTMLDLFTASAIVALADKCEEIDRRDLLSKLEGASLELAARAAWKAVG